MAYGAGGKTEGEVARAMSIDRECNGEEVEVRSICSLACL